VKSCQWDVPKSLGANGSVGPAAGDISSTDGSFELVTACELLRACAGRRIGVGLDRTAPSRRPHLVCQCSWKLETVMFGIEWLRNGVPVHKETSVLTSAAEAIAAAKSRRRLVADRHPGREPDGFRLTDATGKILGVFPVS
jgi:hypothetical protein